MQEKSFPANPIRNLIQIYEGGSRGGSRQDRGHGQWGAEEAGVTKGKTTFPSSSRGGGRGDKVGGERTSDTASAVDEFLASASKARSKYQKMLETPPPSPVPQVLNDATPTQLQGPSIPSPSNSPTLISPPVLATPTRSDLADGCFTDVSYAGSFASWQASPEEEDSVAGGKITTPDDGSQNVNSGTFTEISYAGSFASSKSPSSSSSSSPVQPDEKPPTPPPAIPPRGAAAVPASPRHRRRQRREQLLQEHKTLGREIVLTALRKEEKVDNNNEAEEKEQKRQVEEEQRKKRDLSQEQLLRKMLQEREEEISDLRSACEAWRKKTIASEKDLAEANFTVDKLERFVNPFFLVDLTCATFVDVSLTDKRSV